MPLGYVLTAYALVFFIGVFVGANASDWIERREQRKRRPETSRPGLRCKWPD